MGGLPTSGQRDPGREMSSDHTGQRHPRKILLSSSAHSFLASGPDGDDDGPADICYPGSQGLAQGSDGWYYCRSASAEQPCACCMHGHRLMVSMFPVPVHGLRFLLGPFPSVPSSPAEPVCYLLVRELSFPSRANGLNPTLVVF